MPNFGDTRSGSAFDELPRADKDEFVTQAIPFDIVNIRSATLQHGQAFFYDLLRHDTGEKVSLLLSGNDLREELYQEFKAGGFEPFTNVVLESVRTQSGQEAFVFRPYRPSSEDIPF